MEYSKEEKDCISEAREKIHKIFSMGEFPDNSVGKRHLQKLYGFECLSNGKVRFRLDRHPHAFGFASLGMPSSAFCTITYLYELDTEKNTIIEINCEAGELFINYEWLAVDELQDLFGYDNVMHEDIMEWEEDLQKIDSEEKAKQYAIRAFEEYYIKDKDTYWFIRYDSDDLPEDFKQIFLKEIKKQFVPKMFDLWQQQITED